MGGIGARAIAIETITTERPLLVPLPTYYLLEPHFAFAELAAAAALATASAFDSSSH